jgi:hypothetical protein
LGEALLNHDQLEVVEVKVKVKEMLPTNFL